MSLVDLNDVEICAAGVDYRASTGTVSFTMEDLADAVRAANDDPAIKSPRLKLGHTSKLNAALLANDDGQPALGTVQNMRLNGLGNVILGDYKGVPLWLAEIMASAYPSRSFEGEFNYEANGTQRKYRMVIKAVSLLGVTWPGCATIDDIQALYGDEPPEGLEIAASEKGPSMGFDIAASVNVDDVRRQFYDGPGDSNMFLWIQAVYIDPYEIIVMNEDDECLERYSYSFDTTGKITFGEPESVIVQYVADPIAASDGSDRKMAVIDCSGRSVASFANRSESRPANSDPQGGQEMSPEEFRKALGLPAEATDDEVRSKLAELQGASAATADGKPAEKVDGEPSEKEPVAGTAEAGGGQAAPVAPPAAETAPEGSGTAAVPAEAVAASAGSGNVTVPAEVWASVQAGAQRGNQMFEQAETSRRDETIDKALEKGKIAASAKESMVNLHKTNQDSFYKLLTGKVEEGGLADNLVPVEARGSNPGGEIELAASGGDAYPAEWLSPVERNNIAAAAGTGA